MYFIGIIFYKLMKNFIINILYDSSTKKKEFDLFILFFSLYFILIEYKL